MGDTKAAHSRQIVVDRGVQHGAKRIHGKNPVLLVEKILRERIFDSIYWQKECQLRNQLTLLDEVVEHVQLVSVYVDEARTKPTKFISLVLRLLQLQPSDDIIDYLLNQTDFKYLTALAALYIRLTRPSVQVYEKLEPLLLDYRKLNVIDGTARVSHIDEYIDGLLTERKFNEMILPRLIPREQLEEDSKLAPRDSPLELD